MIDPTDRRQLGEMSLGVGEVVVLCEGPDECFLLSRIAAQLALPTRIGYKRGHALPAAKAPSLGVELRGLAIDVKKTNLRAVGFFFDEEDGKTEFDNSIADFYEVLEVPMPGDLESRVAHVIDGHTTSSLTFISRPSLEHLFLPQIVGTVRTCVDDFIQCYGGLAGTLANQAKQVVRAYLASKNYRNTSLNAGLEDGHLSWLASEFDDLRTFLQNLHS